MRTIPTSAQPMSTVHHPAGAAARRVRTSGACSTSPGRSNIRRRTCPGNSTLSTASPTPTPSRRSWDGSARRLARPGAIATRGMHAAGINAIEQFIGDYALERGLNLCAPGAAPGKKVAIVGCGPAGLACAYQLRRMGHACTVFEGRSALGDMVRYGIPGYRTPRDVLDGEIRRILD